MCLHLVVDAAEETLRVAVVVVDEVQIAGGGLEEVVEVLLALMATAALLPIRTRQTQ